MMMLESGSVERSERDLVQAWVLVARLAALRVRLPPAPRSGMPQEFGQRCTLSPSGWPESG